MAKVEDMTGTSSAPEKPLKTILAEAALATIASRGLDHLSLRGVAATIGRSTTAIFQHFGSKDGLLAAAAEMALDRDMQFHTRFAQSLSGLSVDASALGEIVAHYIESRAACPDPGIAVWPELLFNGGRFPVLSPISSRWRRYRESFWLGIVAGGPAAILAPLLSDYTAMEGAYAAVLHGNLDYRLLLRETIGDFLAGAFDAQVRQPVGRIREWLADAEPPPPPRSVDRSGTLGGRLLDIAAAEIFADGAATLNHRRLTAKAGVSTAMISYHFGSMEQFAREAVWHALLTGLPPYLDVASPPENLRYTSAEWKAALAETLIVSAPARRCGFYVSYSRIVGQTCLLARHRAEFLPLVRHLRLIEGMGIHHASLNSWPLALAVSRGQAAALAIWIKGWAMIAEASQDEKETFARLDAVRQLISTKVAKAI